MVSEQPLEIPLDSEIEIDEVIGGVEAIEVIVNVDENQTMLLYYNDMRSVLSSLALCPMEVAICGIHRI